MAYKFNPFTAKLDATGQSISALDVLGTVANAAALPGGATTGDVYQAEDTGIFYVWDGAAWDNIGTLAGPTGATGPAGVGVVAGGTTGQALVKASNTDYDTQWSDVTAVAAIDDLTDVVITTPSDGQVLEYDSATSQWINATPTGGGGGGTPGGADTQIQFNDGGSFGGDADLTWNKTTNLLDINGDIQLDDGGTYNTTVQCVTPTANRTISFPDATGTVALVAGSSGQVTYNNAGAQAGLTSANIGSTGEINISLAGAASTPPVTFTGSWFTGGTATTTKPQLLIEPTGTTSTAWNTSGTGLGVNAASGFGGNLLDLQVNGTSRAAITSSGNLSLSGNQTTVTLNNLFAVSGGFVVTNQLAHLSSSSFVNLNWKLNWSSSTVGANSSQTTVLSLGADAAGILAQRNGTNAQTYRLYNTYTDASNYERGFLKWNSNVFEIGSEGAGTGSEKPVRITAATLKLPNLPTYADNAAATTGGLVAGDVYKTATGELRITV